MKKSLKLLSLVFASVMMLGIVGCGGSSPDAIADKYVNCLRDADFDAMRQLSSGDMLQIIDKAERKYDEISRLFDAKKPKKFKSTYDDLNLEIGKIILEGDKVTVPIKINGQSTPMTLIRVSDKWRVEKFDFPII